MRCRNCKIEIGVMSNCASAMCERYDSVKRRFALVDDWLRVLSKRQSLDLEYHLMDGISWSQLSNESIDLDLPSDERALQRIQQRALQRLCLFTNKRFGDTLDYLAEKNR